MTTEFFHNLSRILQRQWITTNAWQYSCLNISSLCLKLEYFAFNFTGFANAKTGELQRDEYKIILVSKESVPEPYSTSRALEDTVYKGHKNPLYFMRR